MFLQSAIIENSEETCEWLDGIGYTLSEFFDKDMEILFTSAVKGVYGTIRNSEHEIHRYTSKEHVVNGREDCRGDVERFKEVVSYRVGDEIAFPQL